MKISILEGYHLTAHDKQMIAACVTNSWEVSKSKLKRCEAVKTEVEGVYNVRITDSSRDDWGRPKPRNSRYRVKVTH